jgi:hypothetical protein
MRRASVTTGQIEAQCLRVDNLLHALGILTATEMLFVTKTNPDADGRTYFELLVSDTATLIASEVMPSVLRAHCIADNVIGWSKREAYQALYTMGATLLEMMVARDVYTAFYKRTITLLSQLDPDTCKLAAVLIADGRDWREAIEVAQIINKQAEQNAKTDWVRKHSATFEVAQ